MSILYRSKVRLIRTSSLGNRVRHDLLELRLTVNVVEIIFAEESTFVSETPEKSRIGLMKRTYLLM
jgi:hypothetical protein